MPTGTVHLHRVLRAKPEKIYRAFLDPESLARWLPPNGFTCTVDHLEGKVGGTFRMAFRNFSTGNGHSFGGRYLELEPNARIRYTDKFDDAALAGEMVTTVSCTVDRNEQRRLRVVAINAEINLGRPAEGLEHLDRVLAQFEDFCTVSQSVQAGIPIRIGVIDSLGNRLKG